MEKQINELVTLISERIGDIVIDEYKPAQGQSLEAEERVAYTMLMNRLKWMLESKK